MSSSLRLRNPLLMSTKNYMQRNEFTLLFYKIEVVKFLDDHAGDDICKRCHTTIEALNEELECLEKAIIQKIVKFRCFYKPFP